MKSIKLGLGILLIALLGISCKREAPQPINTPAINITQKALVPNPDESGALRAYIGDEVTAEGFNLDKVGAVRFDQTEAEIVSKDIKKIVFKVPVLDLPQKDEPQRTLLQVFDADKSTVIFKYDFYVTVPVTDALINSYSPKSGTVGTEVTISGRNLTQITKVTFGGVDGDIQACLDESVKVLVPMIPGSEATRSVDIVATWSDGDIDVTSDEDQFSFLQPVFTSFTQADDVHLGDEIVLTGENLDLVDGVKWGDVDLLISEKSATSLTIKVPSGIELMDPTVQAKELAASFGNPAQKVVIAAALRIDTTPVGPAAPVFTSAAPADKDYTAFYLGREVVVKGENFASIEKFKVDGIEAELTTAASDIEARFIMPKTITGTAAKEVDLIAVWNGGNELDCGKITVLPFYYTKGLRLRIGSNSKNSYPAENREDSFLLLDEGRVVSVKDWYDIPVDQFAKSGANTVTTAANMVTGSETDYYSVQPYTFASSNSSNKLTFYNPANSANQLKTHYLDGTTALPSTFGTPVMFFAIVTNETLKAAAAGGTLTDIVTDIPKASAGAPACGAAESSSVWVKGSVLTVQYVGYDYAKDAKKPGDNLAGVRNVGLIHIADITCVDANGAAVASREGYIDIDLYWSNVLN